MTWEQGKWYVNLIWNDIKLEAVVTTEIAVQDLER